MEKKLQLELQILEGWLTFKRPTNPALVTLGVLVCLRLRLFQSRMQTSTYGEHMLSVRRKTQSSRAKRTRDCSRSSSRYGGGRRDNFTPW